MIKKRLMFELIDVTDESFQLWKNQEEEINKIALKYNVLRSNRIDDDSTHTTSVDIEIPNEQAQVQAMVEIADLYEKETSGMRIKFTQQVLRTAEESEIIIRGPVKEEIEKEFQSIRKILSVA